MSHSFLPVVGPLFHPLLVRSFRCSYRQPPSVCSCSSCAVLMPLHEPPAMAPHGFLTEHHPLARGMRPSLRSSCASPCCGNCPVPLVGRSPRRQYDFCHTTSPSLCLLRHWHNACLRKSDTAGHADCLPCPSIVIREHPLPVPSISR